MAPRSDKRVRKDLRVEVRGVDRNGNSFAQTAHTLDISPRGARLDYLGGLQGPGQIIEVRRWWRKARFRVVWIGQIGSPYAGQVGICCLELEQNVWS